MSHEEELKAERLLTSQLRHELEAAKANARTQEIGHEETLHKLERNFTALREENESLKRQLAERVGSDVTLGAKQAELQKEVDDLQAKVAEQAAHIQVLTEQNASLRNENDYLQQQIVRRAAHEQSLKDEIAAINQRLQEAIAHKIEAEQRAADLSTAHIPAKFEQERLQQELESMRKHRDWMDAQLRTNSEQLLEFRKEKVVVLLFLLAKLLTLSWVERGGV